MRDWFISMRKEKNMTQEEIAEKVGVTRQLISSIENGNTNPSVSTAKKIASALGFDWQRFYEAAS